MLVKVAKCRGFCSYRRSYFMLNIFNTCLRHVLHVQKRDVHFNLRFYLSDTGCSFALQHGMLQTLNVCLGWNSLGNKSDIASQHTLGVDSPLDTSRWGNGSPLGWCSEEVNGSPFLHRLTRMGRNVLHQARLFMDGWRLRSRLASTVFIYLALGMRVGRWFTRKTLRSLVCVLTVSA